MLRMAARKNSASHRLKPVLPLPGNLLITGGTDFSLCFKSAAAKTFFGAC
jgi:hypothetical protein